MKDTNELKILCRNIKYLRKLHSLSRKEMAKICHINIITLILVELDYLPAYVTVDIVFGLHAHFKYRFSDLFMPMYDDNK